MGNLQAMRRKTTTSLQQVKVTEVLLWSSPEMPLRETILKTWSLWYDHVVENCEEELYSWLKIGVVDRLLIGPAKSALNFQNSRLLLFAR